MANAIIYGIFVSDEGINKHVCKFRFLVKKIWIQMYLIWSEEFKKCLSPVNESVSLLMCEVGSILLGHSKSAIKIEFEDKKSEVGIT